MKSPAYLQFGEGDFIRVDHPVEFHLERFMEVHQILV